MAPRQFESLYKRPQQPAANLLETVVSAVVHTTQNVVETSMMGLPAVAALKLVSAGSIGLERGLEKGIEASMQQMWFTDFPVYIGTACVIVSVAAAAAIIMITLSCTRHWSDSPPPPHPHTHLMHLAPHMQQLGYAAPPRMDYGPWAHIMPLSAPLLMPPPSVTSETCGAPLTSKKGELICEKLRTKCGIASHRAWRDANYCVDGDK